MGPSAERTNSCNLLLVKYLDVLITTLVILQTCRIVFELKYCFILSLLLVFCLYLFCFIFDKSSIYIYIEGYSIKRGDISPLSSIQYTDKVLIQIFTNWVVHCGSFIHYVQSIWCFDSLWCSDSL